jgi:Ca2+-binding RTX toxin-like protein
MRMVPGRLSIIVCVGVGLGLVTAGQASAAGAAIVGPELLVGDEDGQASRIRIVQGGATYTITDPNGVTPGAGCSGSGTTMTCTGNVDQVVVNVGSLADHVQLDTSTGVFVNAGTGNDVLRQSGTGAVSFDGGPGNERLNGGSGDDLIRGGGGSDRLKGRDGEDRLRAGGGADLIKARDSEEDQVAGGSGNDGAFVDNKDRVRGVERIRP